MDEILFLLLKSGAHKKPVRISTTAIGLELGMSQQNASRKILLLEKNGMVKRENFSIVLTRLGLEEVKRFYYGLKSVMETKGDRIAFTGSVITGFGEGGYYIKKYSQFIKEKLGYAPYPGTLNVKLNQESLQNRAKLQIIEPIVIDGFVEGERKFGGLFLYPCRINSFECAIVIPVRTHHGDEILEIISRDSLRDKIGNKKITIEVTL